MVFIITVSIIFLFRYNHLIFPCIYTPKNITFPHILPRNWRWVSPHYMRGERERAVRVGRCRVSGRSERNLMSVSNLAVCFGPTLLRPEEDTMAAIIDIKFCNTVVETLVRNYDAVRPGSSAAVCVIQAGCGICLMCTVTSLDYCAIFHVLSTHAVSSSMVEW